MLPGSGQATGEIVFNTGMTGYQEVLTDPSYSGQMVVMTYPLIGNYGVNPDDIESDCIQVAAFLIKEYQEYPSNFRSTATLADYLKTYGILGVEQLDTRAITRHIRNAGAMRAIISTDDLTPASLVKRANEIPKTLNTRDQGDQGPASVHVRHHRRLVNIDKRPQGRKGKQTHHDVDICDPTAERDDNGTHSDQGHEQRFEQTKALAEHGRCQRL